MYETHINSLVNIQKELTKLLTAYKYDMQVILKAKLGENNYIRQPIYSFNFLIKNL